MRSVILLLPISIVISSPSCLDIFPRELDLFDVDLFDDESTAPTDDWLTISTEPIESLLIQSTTPAEDWTAPFPESADDRTAPFTEPTVDRLLPPAQPFENFDPERDTISTNLFDLPPSSTSPLTELDLSAPFALDPPTNIEYSTFPAYPTDEEIFARKCAERDRYRYFDVPTRRCDPGTYPFCTIGNSGIPGPLGVSLEVAIDCMFLLVYVLLKNQTVMTFLALSIFFNFVVTHMLTYVVFFFFYQLKSERLAQRSRTDQISVSLRKYNLLLHVTLD